MKLIIILLLLYFTTSCIKNNTDPSWIYIDNWSIESNKTNTEGILSHNFTDAYILVDNKIIGYFELPIKIPLLMNGTKKIEIFPVIHDNGIAATKKIYPFCESYVITTNLIQNKTININPKTRYLSTTNFWIEDFEDAGIKINTYSNFPNILGTGDSIPILKYGSRYGVIKLNKKDSSWLGYTNSQLSLPKSGTEIYLEMDYMNSNSLLTGVIAYDFSGSKFNPNILLNSQLMNNIKWKKIYISLKEIVSYSVNANYFEQYFKADLENGKNNSIIYLDNIKLVYF